MKKMIHKLDCSDEVIWALSDYYIGNNGITDIDSVFAYIDALNELYHATGDQSFEKALYNICDYYNICRSCHHGVLECVLVGHQDVDAYGYMCQMPEYTNRCPNCGDEF